MTLTTRSRLTIFLVLAAVMAATRLNHFGVVPDASWAVFFIAGFYLRGSARWAFPALMVLAVAIDVRDDGCTSEIGTQQQVRIGGIEVQHTGFGHQFAYREGIGSSRRPQCRGPIMCSGRGFRNSLHVVHRE
jgi:hypothetical protein